MVPSDASFRRLDILSKLSSRREQYDITIIMTAKPVETDYIVIDMRPGWRESEKSANDYLEKVMKSFSEKMLYLS